MREVTHKMAIKVYSTPSCPWCARAKQFFKENNVNFQDVDVSKDVNAAHEMIRKSGQQGVPVIDFDGEIIVGFNEPRLRELIKKAA